MQLDCLPLSYYQLRNQHNLVPKTVQILYNGIKTQPIALDQKVYFLIFVIFRGNRVDYTRAIYLGKDWNSIYRFSSK